MLAHRPGSRDVVLTDRDGRTFALRSVLVYLGEDIISPHIIKLIVALDETVSGLPVYPSRGTFHYYLFGVTKGPGWKVAPLIFGPQHISH